MNVRPSWVCIVSGVCTLSSTLTGPDEYSISDRSFRAQLDGIHQARALSARANSVSSSLDLEPAEPGLLGELVPEAYAVVEGAHPQGEAAVRRLGLLHGDGQLVVMVANPGHLAPGLGPPFVVRLPGGVGDAEPVAKRRRAPEVEAEQGREDQRSPIAVKAVGEMAVADLHGDLIAAVGRGDADLARQRGGGDRRVPPETAHHGDTENTEVARNGSRCSR